MDVVDRILAKPFERLPFEEKLQIKQQGRSTSQIDIVQKIGNHNRSFQPSWYDNVSWLTGSAVTKKMYCWPWWRPRLGFPSFKHQDPPLICTHLTLDGTWVPTCLKRFFIYFLMNSVHFFPLHRYRDRDRISRYNTNRDYFFSQNRPAL